MHKGLVNIYPGLYPEPIVLSDMMFGNKIALLGGDYLLGNCCAELAALRNQNVGNLREQSLKYRVLCSSRVLNALVRGSFHK